MILVTSRIKVCIKLSVCVTTFKSLAPNSQVEIHWYQKKKKKKETKKHHKTANQDLT